MSRQLEQVHEERQSRADRALVCAVEFDLEGSVAAAGGELLGFSVKLNEMDCLLILRVSLAGRTQVAFVGASSLADAIRKAVRLAKQDKLSFRPDRFSDG